MSIKCRLKNILFQMFGLSHSTVEVWSAGDVLLRKLLSVSHGPGIFLNNISPFDFHWWRAQPQMSRTSYTISQLAHNQIISLSIQRKTFQAKNIFFHLSTTFRFYITLYYIIQMTVLPQMTQPAQMSELPQMTQQAQMTELPQMTQPAQMTELLQRTKLVPVT